MESKFTGGLLGLIGISLLCTFVSIITLGLGMPWAICKSIRWYAENTVIDGRRVVFDGTAWQLWGNIIKWIFFTIITIGIYALWLPIKTTQWQTKHTHLLTIPNYNLPLAPAEND